jgi:hypothetical protein
MCLYNFIGDIVMVCVDLGFCDFLIHGFVSTCLVENCWCVFLEFCW